MTLHNIAFTKTASRSTVTRTLCTQEQANEYDNISDVARLCKYNYPDATVGEISRFLSNGKKEGEDGFVRPQWVYNALNNTPKIKVWKEPTNKLVADKK